MTTASRRCCLVARSTSSGNEAAGEVTAASRVWMRGEEAFVERASSEGGEIGWRETATSSMVWRAVKLGPATAVAAWSESSARAEFERAREAWLAAAP